MRKKYFEGNMMKYKIFGLLVLVLICIPTTSVYGKFTAVNNVKNTDDQKINVEVTEFKAEGQSEIKIIQMSRKDLQDFLKKLEITYDIETRLQIYKKYDLIREDITSQQLYHEMINKAQKYNIPFSTHVDNQIQGNTQLLSTGYWFYKKTFFNRVGAVLEYSISLHLGTSFLMNRINPIDLYLLRSIDIIDVFLAISGDVGAGEGQNLDFWVVGIPLYIRLIGFVGYMVSIPIIHDISPIKEYQCFEGYAISMVAFGHDPRDPY